MYRIDTLNLSANSKTSQGFIDKLGVEDLTDVTFDWNTITIDKETQEVRVEMIFTSANFKQARTITFKKEDLNKAALDESKSFVQKLINYVLTQPELSGAVKL
tara:strand:- start:14139 stop:14447 length:309 start_codon:yes stop_codon:yes gene_type:complete